MKPGKSVLDISLLFTVAVALIACASAPRAAALAQDDDKHPVVVMDTSFGPITIELDKEKAPITVENFLKYVDSGFYDNLIFHRVKPGFMIQGGGHDAEMREKQEGVRDSIKNESGNGLKNTRGTIAMARKPDPDSATCQFFINLVDNDFLDRGRYAVFGKVVEGMEVVDRIAKVETASRGAHDDVPVKPIVIKSARRKGKS
jgi:cyclophilin family peptidyl-prolyl cis-trans isomerase